MEWAKAKSIIIVLLAAMNVFLLSRIIMDYGSQGLSKEAISNMAMILKSRGVEINCKVPLYDRDTPRLVFGNGIFNTEAQVERLLGMKLSSDVKFNGQETVFENGLKKLTVTGPNSFIYQDGMPDAYVNTGDLDEAEKYLKNFLKERKLDNRMYVPDGMPAVNSDGIVFTYLEKFKGFLVFGNYLKAVVTDKGVTLLEASHRNITGFSPERINDISTAYQVMLENFDGLEKTVISAIDLGYKDVASQDQSDVQSSEQLPVWRIKVNGEYRYFGASDGKEIK